ncbi:MAG: 50S ribosomal protein L18 [Patescibacteria group bacterium]
MKLSNLQLRKRRKARIRAKVSGTAVRPRLSVYRSLQGIYAQLIDDTTGTILASASNLKSKNGNNIEAAKKVGAELAKKAKAKKIETCVFDRSGYLYHGRVKALADAAREGGLKF